MELAAVAVVLDGKLEAGVEEDRTGIIVFQVSQFLEVGREANAGDEAGLARRVRFEVLTEKCGSWPGDKGDCSIDSLCTEDEHLQICLQRTVGIGVEELQVHASRPSDSPPTLSIDCSESAACESLAPMRSAASRHPIFTISASMT